MPARDGWVRQATQTAAAGARRTGLRRRHDGVRRRDRRHSVVAPLPVTKTRWNRAGGCLVVVGCDGYAPGCAAPGARRSRAGSRADGGGTARASLEPPHSEITIRRFRRFPQIRKRRRRSAHHGRRGTRERDGSRRGAEFAEEYESERTRLKRGPRWLGLGAACRAAGSSMAPWVRDVSRASGWE